MALLLIVMHMRERALRDRLLLGSWRTYFGSTHTALCFTESLHTRHTITVGTPRSEDPARDGCSETALNGIAFDRRVCARAATALLTGDWIVKIIFRAHSHSHESYRAAPYIIPSSSAHGGQKPPQRCSETALRRVALSRSSHNSAAVS